MGDPFNWNFPKRESLMSLSTINQVDVGLRSSSLVSKDNNILRTQDIQGATPNLPSYHFTNKEYFSNNTADIAGARPRNLIKESGRDLMSLKNYDIKGTHPKCVKFETKRIGTNPMEPEYRLSHAEIRQTTPPKFIRDSYNIDDIEGTKPRHESFKRTSPRTIEDVDGSKPKKLFIPTSNMSSLDVKDINEYRLFKTTRVTNPLQPKYIVGAEKLGETLEIGYVEGSGSRPLHLNDARKEISLSLSTRDIQGGWAGTLSDKFLRKNERKEFRNGIPTQDVFGAQASTLKKGINTTRNVNPLDPKYTFPGVKEIADEDARKKHQQSIEILRPSQLDINNLKSQQKALNPLTTSLKEPLQTAVSNEVSAKKSSSHNNQIFSSTANRNLINTAENRKIDGYTGIDSFKPENDALKGQENKTPLERSAKSQKSATRLAHGESSPHEKITSGLLREDNHKINHDIQQEKSAVSSSSKKAKTQIEQFEKFINKT